jgi:4-carboxymuconolactone decarboxylase
MAEDLRAVSDCAIPQPLLSPCDLSADPDSAARISRTGMSSFYGQFGHAPGLIDKWFAFYQPIVNTGRVELRTKELCRLRIAARNGCMLCLGGRFRDVDGMPVVDDDDVDAVLAGRFDDPRFTAREQAGLRFTERFRVDHTSIDKAFMAGVLEHFSEGEFIELALCVAQFTGMGQLFSMLGLPSAVPVS